MVRECQRCRKDAEHGPNRARKDGVQVYCRECMRDYHAGRRELDPTQHRAWGKAYRDRLRAEMLREYGGKCACCGEREPVFLALDHIVPVPEEHFRADGRRLGSDKVLADLKRKGWPKADYQILCHNCNAAKAILGRCPHQGADLKVVSA